uniref:Uncharacterized protein n=1 Tax=Aegilops tauschii subsp. strangulata TaxID=200361 RepID=A0A453H7Y1_AEGTS
DALLCVVAGLLVEPEREDGAGPGHERAPGEGRHTARRRGQGAVRPQQHRIPREGSAMGRIQEPPPIAKHVIELYCRQVVNLLLFVTNQFNWRSRHEKDDEYAWNFGGS